MQIGHVVSMTSCHENHKKVDVESCVEEADTEDMTMHHTPRTLIQRLARIAGPTTSPSEIAIRSITEKRSTPRW